MATLFNRVRVSTATTGTGTITLGSATSNAYFTFAEAGVADATVVSYCIEDGTDVEFGIGTYTTAGTTLSRDTVTASKVGGTAGTSKLNLSGSAIVFITALAADITVPPASATDTAIAVFDGTTGKRIKQIPEWTVASGPLASVAGNVNGNVGIEFSNTNTGGSAQAYFRLTSGTNCDTYFTAKHADDLSTLLAVNGGFAVALLEAGKNIYFGTGTLGYTAVIQDDGLNGFGTILPDRKMHVEQDSAATNTVTYVERLTSTSSGTPANGIGVGIEFEVETAAGNNEVGATIEAVTTDVTSTSEDFDIVFKAMAAGAAAAERFRIKGTNTLVAPSGQVAHFWVYWTANSTTILASHNVTSIDDDATGDAGINLTTAFNGNNYAAFVDTNDTTNGWDNEEVQASGINVHTSATVDVLCSTITDGTTAATALSDPDQWQCVGFGVSA
jgi:hypothetical protein